MSSSSRRGRSSSSDDGANSVCGTLPEDGDDSTADSGTQNSAGNSDLNYGSQTEVHHQKMPQTNNYTFDPTKVLIVSLYVGLWVVHYMLVHASGHPRYKDASAPGTLNPAFAILLTEFVKFFVLATVLVVQNGLRLSPLSSNSSNTSNTFWKRIRLGPVVNLAIEVFPCAFFYAVGNNLMFRNLQYFDPTTYLILSSSRLIMTAILMRIFMGKTISQMQQLSILIITAGLCMKKTSSTSESGNDDDAPSDSMTYLSHLGLILIQLLSGVLASVRNEMILKKRQTLAADASSSPSSPESSSPENNSSSSSTTTTTMPKAQPITNIHAINMCLCVESILLNGLAFLVLTPMSTDHSSTFRSSLDMVRSSLLCQGIILSLAMIGIVTSFLICYIDSLSKSVASASTVLFTASLGRILFGYQISFSVICSATFVSVGVHLYTFSSDADVTLASVGRSLAKTVRRLWFIPIFLCLISIFDTTWLDELASTRTIEQLS